MAQFVKLTPAIKQNPYPYLWINMEMIRSITPREPNDYYHGGSILGFAGDDSGEFFVKETPDEILSCVRP